MVAGTAGLHCSLVLQAITRRGAYFRNLAVFLLVWACQAAVTSLFFRCPCYDVTPGNDVPYRRYTYSVMWFVAPTFVFWMMSLLLLERMWRCLIGCRNRPRPYPDQGCYCFWRTLAESTLAPAAWLFFVFIDGTFLECAMAFTPSNCLNTSNIDPANLEAILAKNTEARWKSSIIGLSVALTLIALYFTVTTCYQCCSTMSYYQTRYAEHIQDIEQEAFVDAAREENYPVFKARWRALFQYGLDQDWSDASILPYTSAAKNKSGFVHTQFHGMRFGAESAFLQPESLPPYRPVRRDNLYDKMTPQSNGTAASKHLSPLDSTESTHHQALRTAKNERHKKPRKVQVTSPKQADDDESGADQ